MQRKQKRRSTFKNANVSLPHDLTPEIAARLRELSLSPETKSFKVEYLLKELFTKFVSSETDPPVVRRERAICKWLATEMNNAATNDRLTHVDPDYNILNRVGYRTFVQRCRSIVANVLGCDIPPYEVLLGSFSGGATTSKRRTAAHPSRKYTGEAHISSGAVPYWEVTESDRPLWESYGGVQPVVFPGNVLFTVPKTTSIDRCCAKEPDLNMYMQKGVGDYIRRRLRKFGIDLNDQSRNRDLARQGSLHLDLATLDLSSASDSISRRLVEELLPEHWFQLLDSLRSPRTRIGDEWHVNEMFSSMGNGFTFELESLLFYALARATTWSLGIPGVVSVYGDDIIVPTEAAHDLVFVLQFFGFSTNLDKSFIEGHFRESCGGHFINGQDVTPFYIRRPVTELIELIHVANSLRRWAEWKPATPEFRNSAAARLLDEEVYEIWKWLADQVPLCFWGGHDPADKHRLCSHWKPDKPKRLAPVKVKKDLGLGGYLHWHDSMEQVARPSDTPFSVMEEEQKVYRVKPASCCEPTLHVFPQEECAQ